MSTLIFDLDGTISDPSLGIFRCINKENGLRSVGVLWGFGDMNELSVAGADLIIGAPGELGQLAWGWVDR